jgi:hypothetical protein
VGLERGHTFLFRVVSFKLLEETVMHIRQGETRGGRRVPILISRAGGVLAACVLSLTLVHAVARGAQEKQDDESLKATVAELLKDLDAAKATVRQAAQEKLIKLGTSALPFLPTVDAEGLTAEQKRRIGEIRAAFGNLTGKATLAASKITLSAKGITLSDAMAAIQRQTGNQIVDLRDDFGQPVTNPEFAAEWKDKPFWEVLDEISAKANIGYYLHTGERQVGLVMEPPKTVPTAYAGPLRMQLHQLVRRVSFEDRQRECVLEFEIAWEPRVRPILFEMKPEDLEVLDDQDRKIEVEKGRDQGGGQDDGMALKAAAEGSMIRADFIVRLSQPARGAEKIKLLRGKLGVLMPTNMQTFEYSDLAKAKDVKKQSGNVTVVLEKFKELEAGLWQADVSLQFDAKSEAFESYETWFYDNEAFLQKADGTRFANNAGQTLTESEEGRVGIQYRFVDAPGKLSDYKFVYKTPSTIVRDTVPFELKDIELP